MTKCTFCEHRLSEGSEPACVISCPTGALKRGSLDELPGVSAIPGFTDPGITPSIRFLPLRRGDSGPESSLTLEPAAGAADDRPEGSVRSEGDGRPAGGGRQASAGPKISLDREWPLVVFTLLAAGLVATFAAGLAANRPPQPFVFLGMAGAGILLSSLHLGRKSRAWLALMGIRTSWLSREVAGFLGFVAAAALTLVVVPWAALGWLGVGLGFATLFFMDRVYDVARNPGLTRLHSAGALLTGLFLTGLVTRNPWMFFGLGGVKLVLYLARKLLPGGWPAFGSGLSRNGAGSGFQRTGAGPRSRRTGGGSGLAEGVCGSGRHAPARSLLRLVLGFAVPTALWPLGEGWAHPALLVSALAGELLDRCEFYEELEIPTPETEMALDLARALSAGGRPRPPASTP
jgi:hypothetical protein